MYLKSPFFLTEALWEPVYMEGVDGGVWFRGGFATRSRKSRVLLLESEGRVDFPGHDTVRRGRHQLSSLVKLNFQGAAALPLQFSNNRILSLTELPALWYDIPVLVGLRITASCPSLAPEVALFLSNERGVLTGDCCKGVFPACVLRASNFRIMEKTFSGALLSRIVEFVKNRGAQLLGGGCEDITRLLSTDANERQPTAMFAV